MIHKYRFLLFFFLICLFSRADMFAGMHSFADHSVLATGTWSKIRVSETGLCKLTYEQIKQMGFSNPSNIRVFGYGGAMLSENFQDDKIDDLKEISIYDNGSYILFYAQGPRKWTYNSFASVCQYNFDVNSYSNYGYYFLTDNVGTKKRIQTQSAESSSETILIDNFLDYSSYKNEQFNFASSGKLWYGNRIYKGESSQFSFMFPNIDTTQNLSLYASLAASSLTSTILTANANIGKTASSKIVSFSFSSGHVLATASSASFVEKPTKNAISLSLSYVGNSSSDYAAIDKIVVNAYRKLIMSENTMFFRNPLTVSPSSFYEFKLKNVSSNIKVWNISDPFNISEIPVSLDGDSLSFVVKGKDTIAEFVAVNVSSPKYISAEYVGNVANQDLHAFRGVDFIILSPSVFLTEAQRLASLHEENDDISVMVVTPEQIYNEFSSGTPDATAIRWFMKMLYEREGGQKYLLLFGDGCYDNKGILASNTVTVNNYLPTYQGGSSLDESSSYVTDDYFGLLDDDEFLPGKICNAKLDIGIGRFPVTSITQATNMVNKVADYMKNDQKGTWKNRVCLIADDNEASSAYNRFYGYSDKLAKIVQNANNAMEIKKIYFDAYTRTTGSNGNRFYEVEDLLKEEIDNGVMVMNYVGHSSKTGWSAEYVFTQSQAASMYNVKRGLWFTASCQFTQFDALNVSGGEDLVLNPNGGAIAVYSSARVVYDDKNDKLNQAFFNVLFNRDEDGRPLRIGDIYRLSKQSLPNDSNKMSFTLLGDPALRLLYPNGRVVTDSITNIYGGVEDTIRALSEMKVWGKIENAEGEFLSDFNGKLYVTLYDKEVQAYTKANIYTEESDILANRYAYTDRTSVLFSGEAEVKDGIFSFVFRVPKDINYSYGYGRLSYYAYDDENGYEAQGVNESFYVGGSSGLEEYEQDGPNVQLYLNTTSFLSGDKVGSSPVFYAFVTDESGINASGSGIGHDMTLTLSGASDPVVLNRYFSYSSNSYTEGSVSYSLSDLEDGHYTLTFKVWDLLNNSTTKTIEFDVENGLPVQICDLMVYPNPATDKVSFLINHDQPQAVQTYRVLVYDLQGFLVYESEEVTEKVDKSIVCDWNLENSKGNRLDAGVYVVRVEMLTSDDKYVGKSQKLIVLPQ